MKSGPLSQRIRSKGFGIPNSGEEVRRKLQSNFTMFKLKQKRDAGSEGQLPRMPYFSVFFSAKAAEGRRSPGQGSAWEAGH